jgi:hypothetical protein
VKVQAKAERACKRLAKSRLVLHSAALKNATKGICRDKAKTLMRASSRHSRQMWHPFQTFPTDVGLLHAASWERYSFPKGFVNPCLQRCPLLLRLGLPQAIFEPSILSPKFDHFCVALGDLRGNDSFLPLERNELKSSSTSLACTNTTARNSKI